MTKLFEKSISWAAEKHRQGYNWEDIGRALEVSANTILLAVKASGYPYELPPLEPPEDVPELSEWVFEKLLDGYTKNAIARALGCSAARIEKLLGGQKRIMPKLTTKWIEGDEE